jgi:hypothetical protein
MQSRQGTTPKTFDDESAEQKALRALAWMSDQYLRHEEGVLDNVAMGSGELAMEVLAEHGLVTWLYDGVRFARWTEKGQKLLDRYE